RPGLRAERRVQRPGPRAALLAVRVPQGDGPVRGGPERQASLHVPAVGLVLHHPPGGLLLEQLQRRRGAARRQGGHHRAVGAGSARDREPRHLVGVYPRAGLLPRLVADPQGLAGGRRPARRGRRVGELAAVRLADEVLLLRARVRAVPDHLHRAVPGPDDRPGDRRGDTQGSRFGTRWYLRPCRPGPVLVLLPNPGGQDHPVLGLAVPHVVRRVDLGPREPPAFPPFRLISVFSG